MDQVGSALSSHPARSTVRLASTRMARPSGEYIFAAGDKPDEGGSQKLGPGRFVDRPANVDHSVPANVETVVQITAEEPLGITYVDPADDTGKPNQGVQSETNRSLTHSPDIPHLAFAGGQRRMQCHVSRLQRQPLPPLF
jgi:hypothetical protein